MLDVIHFCGYAEDISSQTVGSAFFQRSWYLGTLIQWTILALFEHFVYFMDCFGISLFIFLSIRSIYSGYCGGKFLLVLLFRPMLIHLFRSFMIQSTLWVGKFEIIYSHVNPTNMNEHKKVLFSDGCLTFLLFIPLEHAVWIIESVDVLTRNKINNWYSYFVLKNLHLFIIHCL